MTILTLIIFLLLLVLAIAFAIIALTLFYHVDRYSYFGDASKRIFAVYIGLGSFIIFAAFSALIINHLIS